ncbi:hypothetical protein DSUL_60194 [Desulfovibrionales bacterium]
MFYFVVARKFDLNLELIMQYHYPRLSPCTEKVGRFSVYLLNR